MKTVKHSILLSVILLLINLILLWLILQYFPNTLSHCTDLNWLSGVAVWLILCTPLGRARLGNERPSLKRSVWIVRIVALQLATFLLYVGMMSTSALLHPQHRSLFDMTSVWMPNCGFWYNIALLGLSFSFLVYVQKKNGALDRAIFLTKKTHWSIEGTCQWMVKGCALFSLSIPVVVLVLSLAHFMAPYHNVFNFLQYNMSGILISCILILFTYRKKKNLKIAILEKKHIFLGFIWHITVWTIVIALYACVVHFLPPSHSSLIRWPKILQTISDRGGSLLTLTFWWMITPLIGLTIARWSYGYRAWELILSTIALPILWWMMSHSASNFPGYIGSLTGATAILAFGLIGFLLLVTHQCNFSSLILTHLDLHAHQKNRPSDLYWMNWKKTCGTIFYLFIPGGIPIVLCLTNTLLIPIALSFFILSVRILWVFFWYAIRSQKQKHILFNPD